MVIDNVLFAKNKEGKGPYLVCSLLSSENRSDRILQQSVHPKLKESESDIIMTPCTTITGYCCMRWPVTVVHLFRILKH